jgi:hypothetical protein
MTCKHIQTILVNGSAGAVCDQKTSKFCFPPGRIHVKTHGCKGEFITKLGKRNTKGSMVGPGGSLKLSDHVSAL